MDGEIVTLIQTTGFPIVCVAFLWRFVTTTMQSFTQTMNENTMMLQKLYDKLDNLDGKEK